MLPKELYNSIDPEILDIIIDINNLPFVARTLFCCAGYGPYALEYSAPFGSPLRKNKRGQHNTPYIVIEYDIPGCIPKYDPGKFHGLLKGVCDNVSPETPSTSVITYRLIDSFRYNRCTEQDIKAAWDKVRTIIKECSCDK